VERLLFAMQLASRPIQPAKLGELGMYLLYRLALCNGTLRDVDESAEDTETAYLRAMLERIPYKKVTGFAGHLPFVVEAAFAIDSEAEDTDEDEERAQFTYGINWSPALAAITPFPILNRLLTDQRIQSTDPVHLVVHVACPFGRSTDRGKTRYDLPLEINEAIRKCITEVTKHWKAAKRKRDKVDRDERKRLAREEKSGKLKVKEAAYRVMEESYNEVSEDGGRRWPANARQIMYVARPKIIELAGKFYKNSGNFTQRDLPDFVAAHRELTKNWDVVYDARGHFSEPHTGQSLGLGTVEVRDYIRSWQARIDDKLDEIKIKMDYPTCGPAHRYKFALFIEKEGFDSLIERARFAERYDLAIFSTKGMSVTAARQLVEELSRNGVTILVLHDFDFAGLAICHTIQNNTRRYKFKDRPNVIDIGLRLDDVKRLELEREPFAYPKRQIKDPRECLATYEATQEEIDFLVTSHSAPWKGKRTELNAMISGVFVRYVEGKLNDAGVKKVVPKQEILTAAYVRARKRHSVQEAMDEAVKAAAELDVSLPKNLAKQVAAVLKKDPHLSWDQAVAQIVGAKK
jgi:hypothetical protein